LLPKHRLWKRSLLFWKKFETVGRNRQKQHVIPQCQLPKLNSANKLNTAIEGFVTHCCNGRTKVNDEFVLPRQVAGHSCICFSLGLKAHRQLQCHTVIHWANKNLSKLCHRKAVNFNHHNLMCQRTCKNVTSFCQSSAGIEHVTFQLRSECFSAKWIHQCMDLQQQKNCDWSEQGLRHFFACATILSPRLTSFLWGVVAQSVLQQTMCCSVFLMHIFHFCFNSFGIPQKCFCRHSCRHRCKSSCLFCSCTTCCQNLRIGNQLWVFWMSPVASDHLFGSANQCMCICGQLCLWSIFMWVRMCWNFGLLIVQADWLLSVFLLKSLFLRFIFFHLWCFIMTRHTWCKCCSCV